MSSPLWHQIWMAIAYRVAGALSILGSLYIIYDVLSNRKKLSHIYFRLVLGMSFFEMTDGIAWFLGPWAVPVGTFWGARGNMQTCELQGFLLTMFVGSALYNASLAVYYLLSIRYDWSERQIRKIEPVMHILALTIAFGAAIAGIPLELYNSGNGVCYIHSVPAGCEQTIFYGYTTCERGDNSALYSIVFQISWLWLCILFTAIAMILIYLRIRSQENAKFEVTRHHSKRFAMQGFLYVAVFYFSHVFSTAYVIARYSGHFVPELWLVASIFIPMEGFFNFLVYIRPKFLKNSKFDRRDAVSRKPHRFVKVRRSPIAGSGSNSQPNAFIDNQGANEPEDYPLGPSSGQTVSKTNPDGGPTLETVSEENAKLSDHQLELLTDEREHLVLDEY